MQRSILFVVPPVPDSENEAALRWLSALPGTEVQTVRAGELDAVLPRAQATVWHHCTDRPEPTSAEAAALDAHVRGGGGALLTLMAAGLPARLGWESVAPNEETRGVWTDEAVDLALAESFSVVPRVRGLQSFRGHPLFEGLGSGAYTWAPRPDEPFARCCYSGDVWPERGRVIAIERSYIAMDPDRRLAWEYMLEDGWVLCIGGSVHFGALSRLQRSHLELVMRNALDRVSSNGGRARLLGGEWTPPSTGLRLDREVPLPAAASRAPATDSPPPGSDRLGGVAIGWMEAGARDGSTERPRLARPPADELYTLAGERALLVGHEREGHREIWFHPFRAVSAWSFSADGLEATEFAVEPGAVYRRLRVGDVELVERTILSAREPLVSVELVPLRHGAGPAELIWTLETDLRLMWPYPPSAPGALAYTVEGGAVGLRAAAGEWLGVRIEPSPEVVSVANASDDGRTRVRVSAELDARRPTRIQLGGALRDEEPSLRVWPRRSRRAEPSGASRVGQLSLTCGDRALEEALEWAKARLASYRVRVPGLGTSLVAGYNSSGRDEFSDGRPGYAWFFGRDACWTALASLAAGQFEAAREVLEFLGRHQDITGKVLHECTTSGVVHYDAADSTPLYLLLATRYLAWTGDLQTLRREWPRIRRAYDYCLTTDTDGDGLIENTDVGHGWVEFGPLGGNHVSLYLAGIWVAALAGLQEAARVLGFEELAGEAAYRAAAARSALELSLYDPVLGRYAVGRRIDGGLNTTESILTAMPLLLDSVQAERCLPWLDRVASEDFTADWGVRMLPRSDPHYRPDGYHTGSAWPLFAGWVSLAEYRARRAGAAFRHWGQVASRYRDFSLGAWPEVLHGDEPRSIGVTPDQAWSTAMTVLPLVVGMLGARPVAVRRRLDLAPQIPEAWPSGAIRDLRVGSSRVSIRWDDRDEDRGLQVDVEGEPLDVRVSMQAG